MSGNHRDARPGSHDHYLGEYACEATPHWTMFSVTRSGSVFALNALGQVKIGDLEPCDGDLAGVIDGGRTRLSGEEGSNRYTFAGEVRMTYPETTKRKPFALPLIRRLPSPGSTWEEKFGVTAADLVRRVRASEQWIHQIESLHLVADITLTRTPEGIAHRKEELKAQFPDEDFSRERFWDLCPVQKGTEELYIGRKRFRCSSSYRDKNETVQIWDGRTYTTYTKYHTHDQESYGIASDLGDRGASLLSGLAWLRTQRHRFWWMGDVAEQVDEGDEFGRPEDFILMGQQDYRGVPCYVLECRPERNGGIYRWFLGIEDGLLRGNLRYGLAGPTSEYWTDHYREVRPACWFPMNQGYNLFEEDDRLHNLTSGRRDITITRIGIDEELPDDQFQMQFKEGVQTFDHRVPGVAVYKYKKDMTEQEWEQIRAEARKRAERKADRRAHPDSR